MHEVSKAVVLRLICTSKDSPWPDRGTPVLYVSQRLELELQDFESDGGYIAAVHDGDLPITDKVSDATVIVSVSVPESHEHRFVCGQSGSLRAAQFSLAEFVIQSVKPGYWDGKSETTRT